MVESECEKVHIVSKWLYIATTSFTDLTDRAQLRLDRGYVIISVQWQQNPGTLVHVYGQSYQKILYMRSDNIIKAHWLKSARCMFLNWLAQTSTVGVYIFTAD